MIGATATFSQSATDGRGFTLRVGTETYTIGLENALLLAHSLLRARKYDLAARICEAVFRYSANAQEAAVLLACCKAGLEEYAVCNHILQAVANDDGERLTEHVEAALLCDGEALRSVDCDGAYNRDAGQESDLGGQSLSDVATAFGSAHGESIETKEKSQVTATVLQSPCQSYSGTCIAQQ